MVIKTKILAGLIVLACILGRPENTIALDEPVDFYSTHVKPIFKAKCYSCHGAMNQEGGLRLDTGAAILVGGDSGSAIDTRDVSASLLVQRMTTVDLDERMPPEGNPLTPEQIETITIWIRDGGHAPQPEQPQLNPRDHWAFQPLGLANLRDSNPQPSIDTFIQSQLTKAGLSFNAPADATTLIRRLYLDLHGLPPSPKAIKEFESAWQHDPQTAASDLANHLLQSPRYGERWGQHWLDIVRYADTDGFEVNTPRPNAWPYRDYVIQSFNDDKPYDRFVFEQLAGDSVNQDAATGFLVAAPALLPGQIGKDDASIRLARQDALNEMIVGTSATFLGLTVGCARCHDHKFDPISQRDYYAMQAFFAGVEFGERPLNDGKQDQRKAESAELAATISELRRAIFNLEPLASVPTANPTIDPNDESKISDETPDVLRRAVDPAGNIERFQPVNAKFVRFTTRSTSNNNRYEPCIDEFQIFSANDPSNNIALASYGTIPTSSGNLSESGRHQLKHINDGKSGNEFSWISNEKGSGWVQLEFPQPERIDHVDWARDGNGKLKDRLPVDYHIDISLDGQTWTTVAGSFDRTPTNPTNQVAHHGSVTPMQRQLKKLNQRKSELDQVPMVFAGKMKKPEVTHVLKRGDPEQPEDTIEANPPALFGNFTASSSDEDQRRIALANWIASPQNPLTARVIVNRVWQHHFGQGLVPTASDFGINGVPPSHPELLDWLTNEFIANGWSLKHLHRLILASEAYQQSSKINPRALSIDADDRLLWRFPSRRLEAESIRDSMLLISGQLNLKMGGPGFDFFKSRGGLSGFPPLETFRPDGLRRMIYSHKIRMESAPVFGAFDCPDAGQPSPLRSQSTTAIQALNLFNSPFVNEQADRFAETVKTSVGSAIDRQIEFAFLKSLGRPPTDAELKASSDAARDHGLGLVCRVLFNSSEFLFIP